jgi:alpha-N-arabinofuranosidase
MLGGSGVKSAAGRVLAGEIHAHNTFDAPESVKPQPLSAQIIGSGIQVTLPPAAVAALEIVLA